MQNHFKEPLMEREFYTVKELSQKFSLAQETIRRMMDRGELPYYQIAGRKRFAKEDIAKYLEQQKREGKRGKP
jgi:excisionase family DNA binding protein